jgi:ATP-binding cassette, subfamily B, bacterial
VGVVVRRYFAAMTSYSTQRVAAPQVTDTYLDVPLAYHLEHPTGELLAHADADVEAATESCTRCRSPPGS